MLLINKISNNTSSVLTVLIVIKLLMVYKQFQKYSLKVNNFTIYYVLILNLFITCTLKQNKLKIFNY